MTKIPWIRPKHVGCAALTLTLTAMPLFAQPAAQSDVSALRNALNPGDTVALTRWSGGKLKGRVIEATDCSLLIDRDGKALSLPNGSIKTVRRYPPAKQNPGAKGLLSFAETCDAIDCAPSAMAIVGLAALFQGIEDLSRQPRIVYAASAARTGACEQTAGTANDAVQIIANARTVAVVGKTGKQLMARGWASPNGDRAKEKVLSVLSAWGRYQIVEGAEAADLLIVVSEYQKNINVFKLANLIAELKVYRGGADVNEQAPVLWSGEAKEGFKKLPATKVAEDFRDYVKRLPQPGTGSL